jgi:RimK family alpha-L-glutamate ligase
MMLEASGLRLFNPARCIMDCDDKARTHLALSAAGVPSIRTVPCPKTFEGVGYTDTGFLERAASDLGFPVVVKDCFGSFGQQVHLARDMAELASLVSGDRPMILQEYVECGCEDLRLEVVGGEVAAAVRRTAKPGDFRANATLGGTMSPCAPTEEEADMAIAAADALEADFCGVDILRGSDGPVVCEVNSNAHLKNITGCTGVDVASIIMRHIRDTVSRWTAGSSTIRRTWSTTASSPRG